MFSIFTNNLSLNYLHKALVDSWKGMVEHSEKVYIRRVVILEGFIIHLLFPLKCYSFISETFTRIVYLTQGTPFILYRKLIFVRNCMSFTYLHDYRINVD